MRRSAAPASMPTADPFGRLEQLFGARLTSARDARSVSWTLDRHRAVVAFSRGRVEARFFERAAGDDAYASVFTRSSTAYALDAAGVRAIVDDVAAFFAGERAPRFDFVAFADAAGHSTGAFSVGG